MVSAARRLAASAVAASAALVLAGAAPNVEPYTIDAILPLTGASAYAGQIHASALRVYESVANASGGIRGRPLHFEIHDDQSSTVTAVQLTNQLLAKHPAVILGSAIIAACTAEAAIVPSDTVEFCLSPGLVTRQHNVFASSIANTFLVPANFRFLRLRGYTRVAVIATTDASGAVADKMSVDALARPENKSLTATFEHFNPNDISVSAQVARVKAADPQAIVIYATGNAFGNVLRALNDAGVHVPVLASAAVMNVNLLAQFEDFLPAELIFNATLFVARDEVRDRPLRVAIDEMYAGYKRAGIAPLPESSFSWDPAKIVVAGLRALGPDATGAQLADYIGSLHGFAGASGVYDFRSGDHHGLTDAALVFVKWVPAAKTFVAVSRPGGAPL